MNTDFLEFFKLQGAGNDFVLLDNRKYNFSLDTIISLTPQLCDRRKGIGADGVLVLSPISEDSYTMIYRNADGSDAGMCGNGARCIAWYAAHHGYSAVHTIVVHDRTYHAQVDSKHGKVTIGFPLATTVKDQSINGVPVLEIFTGTEHIVASMPLISQRPVSKERLKRLAEEWKSDRSLFPKSTNVNFVTPKDATSFILETFERGVEDFTLACGTGAVASAIASHHTGTKQPGKNSYCAHCAGGDLEITLTYAHETYFDLTLTGPATLVFKGHFPAISLHESKLHHLPKH